MFILIRDYNSSALFSLVNTLLCILVGLITGCLLYYKFAKVCSYKVTIMASSATIEVLDETQFCCTKSKEDDDEFMLDNNYLIV